MMQINREEKIINLLINLWKKFSLRRKYQVGILIILTILSSFAEMAGIGLIVPFLSMLIDPDKIFQSQFIQPINLFFNFKSADQLILPMTILFSIVAVIAGSLRLISLWANIRFAYGVTADLGAEIYRHTIYQPYEDQISQNSSVIIDGITRKTNEIVHGVVMPLLTIFSSIILLLLIMLFLVFLEPIVASMTLFFLGVIYLIVVLISKNKLNKYSRISAYQSTQTLKSLREGVGSIRDIIIDNNQEVYVNIFRNTDYKLKIAQAGVLFIGQGPRYVIEALAFVVVAILILYLFQSNYGFINSIPFLGALALGSQRVLPMLQQTFYAWANMKGNRDSLIDVLNLLNQPLPNNLYITNEKIKFDKSIKLNKVSFTYKNRNTKVFNSISFEIPKKTKIGVIGPSGSGKSTLVDIIMGLLIPTKGFLEIDGVKITEKNIKSWQNHIAHVPQSIYLTDGSIAENIAIGVSEKNIDFKRLETAAKSAKIHDLILSWPDKYNTLIGERGSKLSGGQRQRIGIARALYKNVNVIIFDEATSSLDYKTEREIIKTINDLSLNLTIIMITHRLHSLENCSYIFSLENGSIVKQT